MKFEQLLANKNIKKMLLAILIGTIATSVISSYSKKVMADITDSVVRLHILANSDEKEDQELKIKVRDDVLMFIKPMLCDAKNTEDTKKIISKNLKKIEKEAQKSVKKYGYTYSVTASLDNFEFPKRIYRDITLPGGNYDALKIEIGRGDGKNWWCLIYPQLCFSADTDGSLSEESETYLKNNLTKDEYEMLTSKSKLNFKLKIVEMFSR